MNAAWKLPSLLLASALPLFAIDHPLTVTLPSHGDTVRLIVTGDAGATHSRLRAGILAVQKEEAIDAILLAGDNFYPCGISSPTDPQWTKITEHFGPAHVPIFPVLGNHDYGDADHAQKRPPLCDSFAPDPQAEIAATGSVPDWQFPRANYVLRNKLADLIMIDSQPIAMDWSKPYLGSETSQQEQQWLAARLGEAKAPWRIVVGHHTIYSSGVHGRTNGFDQTNMRKILPLLEAGHVDLYICGHDHDMELLGDPAKPARPLFLVSGSGSGLDEMKARKPKALATEPPTMWPSPVAPRYGFAVLEITPSQLAITFHDQSGAVESARFVIRK